MLRRSDALYLTIILAIAIAIRIVAPWNNVFGSSRVDFLETDAWYHVRLVENQVRNFPHHITDDPYAAGNGQYVAVAPLLDTIIATIVFVTRGSNAPASYIERVAALVPPILGVGAVLAVWLLGTRAFGRREGLIAAFLVSFYPGHLLDRSLVGFVDHHALEVFLAFGTLAALSGAAGPSTLRAGRESGVGKILPGVFLALYLLGFTSGALLVAILTIWIATVPIVARADDTIAASRTVAMAAAVALALVYVLQDHGLYRSDIQRLSLIILLAVAAVLGWLLPLVARNVEGWKALLMVVATGAILYFVARLVAPNVIRMATYDFFRLTPDPARMSVMEARPLFLYTGNWNWWQPWYFFRSGFYAGAVATLLLAVQLIKTRRPDHWLIVVFAAAMYAATVGQNRFGYYLVPATTVVIGWLAARVLDWGGVPHADNPQLKVRVRLPLQREIAVMLVAGVAVTPNLVPAFLTATRAGGMPDFWFDVMQFLRNETPPPFSSDSYYYARYSRPLESPKYTVFNWWDQGYWIAQTAHRVPISNPTQAAAGLSAKFFLTTDDSEAETMMREWRARYVIVDWELPFRELNGGMLGGRFENLALWAGRPTSDFYATCFVATPQGWQPQWIFREAYYKTLVYRLMVLGGTGTSPANSAWVVRVDQRTDSTGRRFCEVTERQVYASGDEARRVAEQKGPPYQAVGLSPWQPAFAVPAVQGLRLIKDFRRPTQSPNEAPFARIFEATQPVEPSPDR